ncbi:RagB/SusD family nutrient uptake outer membrane protein [Seleniivibrio sp.]|uniref:RagB/SusD family nutrient uptake outer membrane protein n=1 Tax=Seleniivibrio sp. TaxID=2898801 RepID=UPI0025E8FA96|nr:RagB/SusD family nutrient uptake outer membrane protein [Seleniivibrio sp.]MCD8554907.1 RagB/SusD family nutrient uptake outer membrane protein [Seleniivibrio sp.]
MKNIKILLLFGASIYTLFSSCDDYLEKAPGVDVTEDTIFSSKVQADTYITGTYRYGIHSILPRNETTYTGTQYGIMATATDEAESGVTWPIEQKWNIGDITIDNISEQDFRFDIRFEAIRRTNILMERIDEVPDIDAEYAGQVKGEARFIRALNYFEMLKRYGGMPIIEKKFELSDDLLQNRNTFQEVVDFIVSDCNAAIASLPDAYTSDLRGRATKGAALILKAKTLLYAASPLFNTADPYLDMDDPSENNLICYGNYDLNRWELAADAAKAVIDWAPSGGISLITSEGADKNYRYIFEKNDNSEIILACKAFGSTGIWGWPWTSLMPKGFYSVTWWMGYSMTFNFLKKYEKQDGTSQTWDFAGGSDLIEKYNELDRRFNQSVAVAGSYWNVDIPMVNSQVDGSFYSGCTGGQWITKFIPQSLTNSQNYAMANDIIFRLGEAYLDYAEALNEAEGPVSNAYDAVNIIRQRSGQPDLPAGLDQDQFREKVRNERAIELFDEDHRFWDVRRWLIAEQDGIMQGAFYGLKAYSNPSPPDFRYEIYQFETRSFEKKLYLFPFRRDEALKGYLTQNPGW